MSALKALIELTCIFFVEGVLHARKNFNHQSSFEAFTVRLRAQIETNEFVQHELLRFESAMGMDLQHMIAVAFLQNEDTNVHVNVNSSDFIRTMWRDILMSISIPDLFMSNTLTASIKQRLKLYINRQYILFLQSIVRKR